MSKHLSPEVRVPIEKENVSIFRDEERCIKCGQCRDMCRDYIGVLGTYDLLKTGDTAICINCGQCANVCPVESIREQPEYGMVAAEVMDPDKIVVVSTSPSVRAALGEEFGMEEGSFVQGKMVALLRTLGVDYVLDTNFAADLTIVEEASELIDRITTGRRPLPSLPAAVLHGSSLRKSIIRTCFPIYLRQRAPSVCRGLPLRHILPGRWESTPERS